MMIQGESPSVLGRWVGLIAMGVGWGGGRKGKRRDVFIIIIIIKYLRLKDAQVRDERGSLDALSGDEPPPPLHVSLPYRCMMKVYI